MAPDHPRWMRLLLHIAGTRATDAELGDIVEEYAAGHRSAVWLIGQVASIVRRRRSPLTIRERGAEMLSNVAQDIRYAVRTLARNPGFAVAAIVPIALGIGINTGIFSILNSVAWRDVPASNPGELVSVHQDFRGAPRRSVHGARALFSIPEYRAYRDSTQTLTGLMAFSRSWTVTLGRQSPEEIEGILVTCNYFDVLQLHAAIGTGFTTANCGAPGGQPVVILSHALWSRAFGSDSDIVQKSVVLNGVEVAVVGVAPVDFAGIDMAKADFFAPTWMQHVLRPEQDFHENADTSWLTLIGRRRADASIADVRAELAIVASRIDQQQPGRTTSLIVEPAAALSLPVQRREIMRLAAIVMTAFGVVLVIASANVANILLARAAGRTKEIAIRLSVGAKRGRLVQQLLTESSIIALAGGIAGSALCWWSFQALIAWLPTAVPGIQQARIDATPDRMVFWFALALTAVTALVFGLVPAIQASKSDVHAVMKRDGADSTGSRGWVRGALVGTQIALCAMLLIPAGLLARALYAAHSFDPGFEYRNVYAVAIELRGPRYESGAVAAFHEDWLARVRTLPGVERVAQAGRLPLSPGRTFTTFQLAGDAAPQSVDVNTVSADYFSLIGIPIVRGRGFTDAETDVAVVTEATARRHWPGQDVVGRTITMDGIARRIVGVAKDAQVSQSSDALASYMYLPPRTAPRRVSVLARTRMDFDGFAKAVRAQTSQLDPNLVVRVHPLEDNLAILRTMSQITAGVAGLLSVLALGLAALGVYGVVAYVVSRRRREVGIRMTLGASARDVQRMVVRQTLRPVAIGLLIGIGGAAAASRVLERVLFGVSPFDAIVFVGAPLFLLCAAAAAAVVPTRQVAQLDPMSVLRYE